MKNPKLLLGTVAICLCLAVQAKSQTVTGVTGTFHDLNHDASFGVGPVNTRHFTGEVCLPCHTPHAAAQLGGQLLWNHTVTATATTYKLYNSAHTTENSSTTSANPELDNASLMCLSCHDGSIAIDSYGGGSPVTGAPSGGKITWGLVATATDSTDLTADHPLGVGYPGVPAGTTVTSFTGTGAAIDYADPTASAAFKYGSGVGGIPAVKLVSLPNGYMGVGCVSCHEPHDFSQVYMRVSNNGSKLCLSCHIK